ncbi:hypothetical protein AFM12_11610 [Jiulongibacter sediminis]|uniref:Uncharacterized protein n=1 Tax=Jiulongibacter sediminis TaxID=1605367 RepID=A0A0N8H9N6_9BACT|nr:hypothetical protein AFM12_11610 [Jiulongibacter sediminis]
MSHANGQDMMLSEQSVSVQFLSDSMHIAPGKFGFNTIRIFNHSSESKTFRVKMSLPSGWSLLRDLPASTEVRAGEENILSFRLKPGDHSFGGKPYPVIIDLEDALTGEQIRRYIRVVLSQINNWDIKLLNPVIYVGDDEALPNFSFYLYNHGNRYELFEVDLTSEFMLTLPSKGTQILLGPATDTLITVGVRSRQLNQLEDNIVINVASRGTSKTLQQRILISPSEFKANPSDKYILPLSLRWQANGMSKYNFSQILNLSGDVEFENGSFLGIRSQSFIFNDKYDARFSYHSLAYRGKKARVEVGSVQDFFQSQIFGIGGRVGYHFGSKDFEVLALRPTFYQGISLGFRQSFSLKNAITNETEAYYSVNKDNGVTSSYVENSLNLRNKKLRLRIGGGLSNEKAEKIGISENGYSLNCALASVQKWFSVQSNVRITSSWFPGTARGLNFQNHQALLHLGPLRLGGFANTNTRTPSLYKNDFTEYVEQTTFQNTDYGFQFGSKIGDGLLTAKAGEHYQLQNVGLSSSNSLLNSPVVGKKLSLNYFRRGRFGDQVVQLNMVRAGMEKEGQELGLFNTYNASVSGKVKSLGFNLKYEYGPFYYFDYLYYDRTSTWQNRQQYALFWSSSQLKRLKTRLSANYYRTSQGNVNMLNTQAEVEFDFPSREMSFSMTNTVNVLNPKNSYFVSVAFYKTFNLKLPFKKYHTLRVRLFKDSNANNTWDASEQPLKGANLIVNGQRLRTNSKGEGVLKNIKNDNYVVDLKESRNIMGWLPDKLSSDTIQFKKDTEVSLAFKESKTIHGKISLKTSDYSLTTKLDLSGMLIIAKNQNGQEFTTLTTENGEFNFNLFSGVYTVQMPASITGTKYYFEELTKTVNLQQQKSESIEFQLIEKKRKLNIRRSVD